MGPRLLNLLIAILSATAGALAVDAATAPAECPPCPGTPLVEAPAALEDTDADTDSDTDLDEDFVDPSTVED